VHGKKDFPGIACRKVMKIVLLLVFMTK